MHIDEYRFGHMLVDGRPYEQDLILLPDGVVPGWRRQAGHELVWADLAEVLAARPEVLVIGCGQAGRMRVPAALCQRLDEAGIELEVAPSGEAVARYNRLAESGRRVAGAFHLTC